MEESKTQTQSSVAASQASPVEPVPSVVSVQELPQSGNSSKKAGIFLIILALIVAGCGGYYLFTHKVAEKAAVVVKKDIPVVNLSSGEKGYNAFYPGIDNSNNFIGLNRQIFEGLVVYQDSSRLVPLLATSWTNPDNSTWIFNLKHNVMFHTGRVMTADDVKASIDAAANSDLGSQFNTTIKSVTVLAPDKIQIKTDGPDPILLNRLSFLWIFDTKSDKKNDAINGTGPYVVKAGTTPTNEEADLVAFDNYHGGHVNTRAVNFVFSTDTDLPKKFNDGRLNYINFAYTDHSAEVTVPHNSLASQELSVFHIIVNSQRADSPLANKMVRQALIIGTDPLALAKVRGVPSAAPAGQIIPPTVPGYLASVKRPDTDVAKAKAMLAAAGYPKGFDATLTYFAKSKATAEEISHQFAAMGITVKLDPQDIIKNLAEKVLGGKTDLSFNTISTDLFDGSDVFAQYLDGKNYKNTQASALLDQSNKTLDSAARLKLLQQINQLTIDDPLDIPVYIPDATHTFTSPNFVIKRDTPGTGDLGVYFWKAYQK